MKRNDLDKTLISILVATKNRQKKLRACIKSLLNIQYRNYKIIIIDQGEEVLNWNVFTKPLISYFHVATSGKSKALNFGLQKIKGDIVVFTDDDCLVDPLWLQNIVKTFKTYKNIGGVFGKVLPYKPENNLKKICPSTFEKTSFSIISKPCAHYKYIGFGNNMAIRRSIFADIGIFREWLGPGSIGLGAVDAEFALRMLLYGRKIIYNPKVVVYHNKWLTPEEMLHQNLLYSCGEMACYFYFYFQRHSFATQTVFNNIWDSYYKVKSNLKEFFLFRWNKKLFQTFLKTGFEIWYRLRGFIVGYVFALIDQLKFEKTN